MNKMILSAELSTLTTEENRTRTERLRLYLIQSLCKFKETVGGYSGNMEISFILEWNSEIAEHVLDQFKQECVMKISGKDLACFLYYGDPLNDPSGFTKMPKFRKIGHVHFIEDITELRYCDGWTFDPSNDLYFTVR